MMHGCTPAGQAVPPDPFVEGALGPLLLGILAQAAPGHDRDRVLIAAARQHSMRLGRLYAERGHSAHALALAYRYVLWQTRRLMPPVQDPGTVEHLRWGLQVQRAGEHLLLAALFAFERGRQRTAAANLRAAQDQAVQHVAAALRETLLQTLTLCMGYTELLSDPELPRVERQQLLSSLLEALDRLAAELRRWLGARRYVTQHHGAGGVQLDVERASEPTPVAVRRSYGDGGMHTPAG